MKWHSLMAADRDFTEAHATTILGVALKETYVAVLTAQSDRGLSADFQTLLTDSVEHTAVETAKSLERSYGVGTLPQMDDTPDVAREFTERFVMKFREAICAELYDNPDLSTHARGLVVVLVPTVITLLALPLSYAALAIPISVLVSRIGTRALCDDLQATRKERKFLNDRLDLHRRNLLAIEGAMGPAQQEALRTVLEESRDLEERLVRELEERLARL